MSEVHELTAAEGLRAIEAGNLTAEAWTTACLERITDRDSTVLAWEYLDHSSAIAHAREIDNAVNRGLVAGVPFGVKDIIDTADMPTAYGTEIHRGHLPGRDAACVAITRSAGAVLLGKTVSTEFGHKTPGKTCNPFNPAHTPGGSSSGSAAAVGDKMIPFAYGTQTTGSVIRPAAFCGTIGYKPTYGDINNSGVMGNTPTIDTLGMMVRTVEDLSLLRAVLLEQKPVALAPPEISNLAIGVYRTPFWDQAEPYMQSYMEAAVTELAAMGASVSDVELPGIDSTFEELHGTISGFEFCRTVAWERFNRLNQISLAMREGRMKDGIVTTYEEYRNCTRRLEQLRMEADDFLEDFDILITPTAPGEPPEGLQATGNAIFNSTWTALGTPAVTLPLFEGPNGLPVGLQLISGRFKDRQLFDASEAVLKALTQI